MAKKIKEPLPELMLKKRGWVGLLHPKEDYKWGSSTAIVKWKHWLIREGENITSIQMAIVNTSDKS